MKISKNSICEEQGEASGKNTELDNCLVNGPEQTPGDNVDVAAPEALKKNSHENNSGTIFSETLGKIEKQCRENKSSEKDTLYNDARYDNLTGFVVSNYKIKQEVDEQLDEAIGGTNLVSLCGLDKSGYSLCSNQNKGDRLSLVTSENDKGPYKKPHRCEQCETSFRTPYELERHGRIHSGERPYKCQLCDMCFKRKDHVEVHMKRHIEDRQHVCDICGMWFVTSSCLLRHRRRTHQVFDPPSNIKPKHQPRNFDTEYSVDARCGVTEQVLSPKGNQGSLHMEKSQRKCKRPKSKVKVDSTYRPGGKTVCILKKRKLRNRSYSFAELEDDIECFETDEEDTIPYLKIQTKNIKLEDDNMTTEVCELEHSLFPTKFFSHAASLDHMLLMGEVNKLISDRSVTDLKENDIEDSCASNLALKSGYPVSKQNEQSDVPIPRAESEESEVPLISCDVSFDEQENESLSSASTDSNSKKNKICPSPNTLRGTGDKEKDLLVDTLNNHMQESTPENDSNKILDKVEKGTSTEDGETGTKIEDGETGTSTEGGETGTRTEDGETRTRTEDGETGASTEGSETGTRTEDGETGTSTEDGETGTRTEDGETGTSTEDGETGTRTEDGETGTRNEDGETGTSTDDGETGIRTEYGETGTRTEYGETGTRTEDGETGTRTEDGETGTRTEDGETGTRTEDGETGTRTEDGETGIRTEDGETGTRTEDGGTRTEDGKTGTRTENGETGTRTENGETGTRTEDGETGTRTEAGETGTRSEDGETGTRSKDGETETRTEDYNSVESEKIQVVEEEHAGDNNEQYSQLLKIICQSLRNRSQAGENVPSECFQDSTSALTESQISKCLTRSVVSRSRRSIWQNYNFRKKSFNKNRSFLYMRCFKEDPDTKVNTYKKPHKCHLCDLYFRSPSELKRHARIHSGERPYLCELCGSGFIRKCHLQLHVRRHTGERRHACRECGMMFFTTSDLNRHMLIHKTNKPFKCHICTVTYRRASHLEQHIRSHVNATPFMCHLCGTFFTTSASLKKHEKHHFSIDPYSCPDCSASFTTSTSLSKHRRVHTDPHYNLLKICIKGMKISDQYECISSEGSPLSLVIRRVAGRAHLKMPGVETCANDRFNTIDTNGDDITKQYVSGWESQDCFEKESALQNGRDWNSLEKQARNAREEINGKSNGLHEECNGLHKKGNGLHEEGNGLREEGNCVHEESNGVCEEGNGFHEEGNGLHEEGNGVCEEVNGHHEEGNGLYEEGNGLCQEGNGLHEEGNGLHEESNGICEEGNGLHEEGNGFHEESSGIHEEGIGLYEESNGVYEESNGVHVEGNGLCKKGNYLHEKLNDLCEEGKELHEDCNGLHKERNDVHEERSGLHEEHNGLHEERNDVHEEHNVLHEERNGLHEERSGLHEERNSLHEERNGLHEERNGLHEERNGLHEERNGLHEERNGLHEERNGLHEERNGLHEERNGLHEERNGLHEERNGLHEERNGLHEERNGLHEERNGLHEERNGLHEERNGLHEERNGLHEERNGLLEERNGLHEECNDDYEEHNDDHEECNVHEECSGFHERNDLRKEGNDLCVERNGLHEEHNDLRKEDNDLCVEYNGLYKVRNDLHKEHNDLHVECNGLHKEDNGLHVECNPLHKEDNGLHEKSNHFADKVACLTGERQINDAIDVSMKDKKPLDFEHDNKLDFDKTGDILIKLATPRKGCTNSAKNIQSQDCQFEKDVNKALLNIVSCTEVLTKAISQNLGNSPQKEFTTFGSCILQNKIYNNKTSCSKLRKKCIPNEGNCFIPSNMIKWSDRKTNIYKEDVDSRYSSGDKRSVPETINSQETGAETSRTRNVYLLKNKKKSTEKTEICIYKNYEQNGKEVHDIDAILESQGKTSALVDICSNRDCLVKEIETVYQDMVRFNVDDISSTSEKISPLDSCIQSIKDRKLGLNKLEIDAEHNNFNNLDKYYFSLSKALSNSSRHERWQPEDTRGLHTDDETTELLLSKTVPTSPELPCVPLKLSWPKPPPVLPILFNDGQKISMYKDSSVASDMKKDGVGEFSDTIYSLLSKEKQKDDRLKQSCVYLSSVENKGTAQQKSRKRSSLSVNEGYEIRPQLSTQSVTMSNKKQELSPKSKHLAFATSDKHQEYTGSKPLDQNQETNLQSVNIHSILSRKAQELGSETLAERQHLSLEPPGKSQRVLEHKPMTVNYLGYEKYGNTQQDLVSTSFSLHTNQVREAQCIPSIYKYMSGISYGRMADVYSVSSHILTKPQEPHHMREILAKRENYMNSLNFQISNILARRSCTTQMASSSTCPSFNHSKVDVD